MFAQALTSKSISTPIATGSRRARILLEGALERALAGEFHAAAVRAFNNLAVVLESSDRYDEAVELTERALELARRMGDRIWEGLFVGGPIISLVMLGRWDEALAHKDEFESLGGEDIDAGLVSPAVEIFCARGDVSLARAWLDGHAELGTGEEDIQIEPDTCSPRRRCSGPRAGRARHSRTRSMCLGSSGRSASRS